MNYFNSKIRVFNCCNFKYYTDMSLILKKNIKKLSTNDYITLVNSDAQRANIKKRNLSNLYGKTKTGDWS